MIELIPLAQTASMPALDQPPTWIDHGVTVAKWVFAWGVIGKTARLGLLLHYGRDDDTQDNR